MGQKHSKPSQNQGNTGTTQVRPNAPPSDQPPPAYDDCAKAAWLPREHVLIIIESVDQIMKEVVVELDGELDGSPDVLVAAGHIRESCTVAARTVTRTKLPNTNSEVLFDDIKERRTILAKLGSSLTKSVAEDKRVAVILIWANAVTKAAYAAKSDSQDYRTAAWAALVGRFMHELAAGFAIKKWQKINGAWPSKVGVLHRGFV
ncbi:unnamed protein product [Clonostachys byssicola]|uniref:Uncharacterized protein n=1 Tax=Clonostachys byssicola TaxID=160290 RepID=A0A9N9UBA2_9HYPO|nr:unnamed protein product [Clonostachys byssicola]